MKLLWELNTEYRMRIQFTGAWNHVLWRNHDQFLMDGIVKVVKNPEKLCRINDVRLYLKLAPLSDTETPGGASFKIGYGMVHLKILPWFGPTGDYHSRKIGNYGRRRSG